MFPLSTHNYIELAALITSVIFWYKIKNTYLRWFLPFLLFINIIELSGRYIRKVMHAPNAWLYNISVPIEYVFYAFFFYTFFKRKFNKMVAKIFLIVFPVWVIINISLVEGFYSFNTHLLIVGSFFMLLLCLLFFIELLRKEDMYNPVTQPAFWIVCGLFLFSAGEFAYDTFSHILMVKWEYGEKLFHQINNNLIFVLYSCIIIAIISSLWKHEEQI